MNIITLLSFPGESDDDNELLAAANAARNASSMDLDFTLSLSLFQDLKQWSFFFFPSYKSI